MGQPCTIFVQVVVVSGETGSGKTTQVPQFIFDDAIARGRGDGCNIICTQPRRISATSAIPPWTLDPGSVSGVQIDLSTAGVPKERF